MQTTIQKPHGNHTQKSIIDIHTNKKKESKHNTKDNHQITREEKKKRNVSLVTPLEGAFKFTNVYVAIKKQIFPMFNF